MPKIEVEEIGFKDYGKCLKITNGIVEAVVTLDIGPRVIRFAFKGGENFFHEDLKQESFVSGEPLEAIFGKGSKWLLYGGHRLWLSPEDMPMSYYPDNEPVQYKRTKNGFEFISPAQRINDVQYKIELIMPENKPGITVNHFATNTGGRTIKRSPWAITAMKRSGLEVIPQPLNNTGLLPNRNISLWPVSDMSDERIYWGKKYITLKQETDIKSSFKFGINNTRGWAAYFVNNGMFVKQYYHNPDGCYPDKDVSYETFTNNYSIEMETLGEFVDITPGSTVFHSEEWTLVDNVERPEPNDEITLDTLVKLYIEK